jgi:hypothetical protein
MALLFILASDCASTILGWGQAVGTVEVEDAVEDTDGSGGVGNSVVHPVQMNAMSSPHRQILARDRAFAESR